MRGAADAEDAAFEALYSEHAGAVFAFCLRFTGDRALAQDAVQEVFLRAWRAMDSVDLVERPVRPWLLTVARHLLTDAHRSAAARPRTVNDDSALAGVPAADEIDRAVQSWLVADALRTLSPEHREVLLHTHWGGRSVAESAAILGIPPGTVKSRTYYALRALRLALEEKGLQP